MDDAVDIGFTLGLGLAAGLLLAGLFAAWRYGFLASALGALVVGILAGLLVRGWIGLPGAFAGALIGAVSASIIARGTLRRRPLPSRIPAHPERLYYGVGTCQRPSTHAYP